MGLGVSVGFLDDLRRHDEEGFAHHKTAFARLSAFLEAMGQPGHVEPEKLAKIKLPQHASSFPYSFLHYLRRAFAIARTGAPVTPCEPGDDPADDPLIDDELTLHMDSHLVCHADNEGYYVPIDFSDVLYGTDEHPVAGGMVGSSRQLLRELARVAPAIGVTLKKGAPSAAELKRIAQVREDTSPLWREQMVWLTLWVCARASVEHGTAIVFC